MKTDDASGEAAKPPEENTGKPVEKIPEIPETYDELQWARRQDLSDPAKRPKTRKTRKGAKKQRLVFRKTELHDRPRGARADRKPPAPPRWTRVAEELDIRIVALDERADAIEFRLEQEIKRLENRMRAPGRREGS